MFPIVPANSAAVAGNKEGLFGFGNNGGTTAITNKVSNAGVVSADIAGVGTDRHHIAACEYGEDKGIFGFGYSSTGTDYSMTNLVSNAGVVASDTSTVGTARRTLAACGYGEDKGIFNYGMYSGSSTVMTTCNLVSNAGVIAANTTGVGTARARHAATQYGEDKGIIGFGWAYGIPGSAMSLSNLVSNVGIVQSDQAATTGTSRWQVAACSFGGDKGIFGFGASPGAPYTYATTNLVSNTGVVATDTTGVGTVRAFLAACEYAGDKGIFGFGGSYNITNLVSNTGVVAADQAATTGTARSGLGACSFN